MRGNPASITPKVEVGLCRTSPNPWVPVRAATVDPCIRVLVGGGLPRICATRPPLWGSAVMPVGRRGQYHRIVNVVQRIMCGIALDPQASYLCMHHIVWCLCGVGRLR